MKGKRDSFLEDVDILDSMEGNARLFLRRGWTGSCVIRLGSAIVMKHLALHSSE